METQIERTALLNIIQTTQRATQNKNAFSILSGILLEAKENSLIAQATDLELSIKNKTAAKTRVKGKVVVLGSLLGELIKNFGDGRVLLKYDDKERKLILKHNKSEISLNTLPLEEFPTLPKIEQKSQISIKSKDFIGLATQIIISVSKEEGRPVLNGVLLDVGENGIKLVATDSYRLSVGLVKVEEKTEKRKLIIPKKTIGEIIRVFLKEKTIKMVFSDKQVAFKGENCTVVSGLIGGKYPSFERLFPKEKQTQIKTNRRELLAAIKKMAILSSMTPVVLTVNDEGITVMGKSVERGKGEEMVKGEREGKKIEIAFNPQYLIEALNTIQEEKVIIELISASRPGIIRGADKESCSHLIMPIRCSEYS